MKLLLLITLCNFLYSFESRSETVTLPVRALPTNLEVDNLIEVDQNRVLSLMAERLIQIGDNFTLAPKIAKSVKWSKDGLVLSLAIRDLKFSDGSKITASHVVSSIKRCIKRSSKGANLSLKEIVGYEGFILGKSKNINGLVIKDDDLVQIRTNVKTPLILDELSHNACSIIKIKGTTNDLLKGAVGYGPYKLKSIHADRIILNKNPYYKDKNNGPSEVIFRLANDFGNLNSMIQNFDLIYTNSNLDKINGFHLFKESPLRYHTLTFNNELAPFDKANIRKAIRLAIDFEELQVKRGWKKSRMQKGIIPFGMKGYERRSNLKPNINESEDLLKSFGYSKEKPLKFDILLAKYENSNLEIDIWPNVFKTPLIKANVVYITQRELMNRRNKGEFQILRIGKAPGSVEPHLILASFMKGSKFNTPRANVPECESIIKSALIEADIDKRFVKYKKSESCLLEKDIIVPLATVNEGKVFIRKPWKLSRKNKYLLYPYKTNEWVK